MTENTFGTFLQIFIAIFNHLDIKPTRCNTRENFIHDKEKKTASYMSAACQIPSSVTYCKIKCWQLCYKYKHNIVLCAKSIQNTVGHGVTEFRAFCRLSHFLLYLHFVNVTSLILLSSICSVYDTLFWLLERFRPFISTNSLSRLLSVNLWFTCLPCALRLLHPFDTATFFWRFQSFFHKNSLSRLLTVNLCFSWLQYAPCMLHS